MLSRYVRVPFRDKYRIPCPIHGGENWSSFSVDEDKGLFHCFKCGAAGDVVTLLAKLEGVSNIEAGRRLMAEHGIRAANRDRNFDAVWDEVKRWEPQVQMPTIELPPSEPLTSYRGFSLAAIEHFGLRRVPTGVLIPFRDSARIVGYAIRQTDRQPKYLNSEGFRKSDLLYGFAENEQDIIGAPMAAIVCEGQFSAIRVWDAGYFNVVATLGASMSPSQAHILASWCSRITILYDGDEAGRKGALKIKELYSSILNINIINLPEGEDPDVADLSILK